LGGREGSALGERGIMKRLAMLARHTDLTGDRLLDIGCGPGTYTIHLAAGYTSVDALDIEPLRLDDFRASIAGTAEEGRITIHEASATDLDFPDATFDAVTAIEVIEHLVKLDRVLDEVYRVLKPGGSFLATTPNRFFPFEQHGFNLRGVHHPPSHFPFLTWIPPLHHRLAAPRVFTPSGLRSDLTSHGFTVTAVECMMPPFDRSGVGRRLFPLTERLEHTPARWFGSTLVATARR
jgi:SAM-dependent methyltransferase